MKKKRIISALLAAAMVITMTSCNDNGNGQQGADTSSSADGENPDSAESLSKPVEVNEDGSVNMDKALAYETDCDKLVKELEAKEIDGTKPVSANSNKETVAVFDFLRENYGKNMITAQQLLNGKNVEEILYYNETGDLPAMMGFDFMDCTGPGVTNDSEINDFVQDAIDWHTTTGGLVCFCWHWRVPCDIDDLSKGYAFYQEEITNFNQVNAVTPGTKEYEQVIHDIDAIAIQIQALEAAGVPIIFRPLHEASGSWFWWGVQDKASVTNQVFQKLWYMIYDRLENYHKLTNIIWVWNGQNKATTVNPNTYDIAGTDIYPSELDHSAQQGEYNKLAGYTDENKMIALTECGYIPDPEEVFAEGSTAKWLYYMPWYGDFVCKATSGGQVYTDTDGTPSINEERLTSEFLKKLFENEHVITWKDLPSFDGGEKELPESISIWKFYSGETNS